MTNNSPIDNALEKITRLLEVGPSAFEIEVPGLSLNEKEHLQNTLRSKGLRARFYTECKTQLMGIWKG